MSNLGLYQIATTISKKVRGPQNLALLIAGGGYVCGKLIEFSIRNVKNRNKNVHTTLTYVVHKNVESSGLLFKEGGTFRVLERDGDSVLIEKIGDKNNPYVVSAEFLSSISTFE